MLKCKNIGILIKQNSKIICSNDTLHEKINCLTNINQCLINILKI